LKATRGKRQRGAAETKMRITPRGKWTNLYKNPLTLMWNDGGGEGAKLNDHPLDGLQSGGLTESYG